MRKHATILFAVSTLLAFVALASSASAAVEPPTGFIEPIDPTSDEAQIVAHVNPHEAPTEVGFEISTFRFKGLLERFSYHDQTTDPGLDGTATEVTLEEIKKDLFPDTEYTVGLFLSNEAGYTFTDSVTFTTDSVVPAVQVFGADTTATTAKMRGRVNPFLLPAAYHFEYSTDPSLTSATVVPVPDESLPAAGALSPYVSVTGTATGLSPDTRYYFRLVSSSGLGTTDGLIRSFRTAPAAPSPLPQRSYEKVSIDSKSGFDFQQAPQRISSRDGNRIIYFLNGSGPGSAQGFQARYIATRTSKGWVTKVADAPALGKTFVDLSFYHGDSADVDYTIVADRRALTSDGTDGRRQLYRRNNLDGSYRLITPIGSEGYGVNAAPHFVTGTPDFDAIVYRAETAEEPGDPVAEGSPNTYRWVAGKGIDLAGVVDPDGAGPEPEVAPPGGTRPVPDHTEPENNLYGVAGISDDGQRLVFRTVETGDLYVRDYRGGTPESIQVNASQRTDCAEDPSCGGDGEPDSAPASHQPAAFLRFSDDGDTVLFRSCGQLTDDAAPDQSCDYSNGYLYRYNVATGQLTNLTPTTAFASFVAASSDLSVVYLTAEKVLTPGATQISRRLVDANGYDGSLDSDPNLYVYSGDQVRYVGSLMGEGSQVDTPLVRDSYNTLVRGPDHQDRLVRITPDGEHLLFGSRQQLTGYDNHSPKGCPHAANEASLNLDSQCMELYLYDLAEDTTTCVSCRPSGEPPAGDAYLEGPDLLIDGPNGNELNGPRRNLSFDGSRVFFESNDDIVRADTNGKQDVYLWDRGRVSLVSTGQDGSDSHFVDASEDGSTVFFDTRQHLTPSDIDGAFDLYAARIDGGFGPEPVPPAACEGDACQSPVVPPNDPTPASAGYSGAGNLASPGRKAKAKKKHHARKRHHGKRRHHGREKTTRKHG